MDSDHVDQRFSCSTCRLWLTSVDEQRAHFQTPLHAFNVRRKVVNMVPVSQEQFDAKVAETQLESSSKAEREAAAATVLCCKVKDLLLPPRLSPDKSWWGKKKVCNKTFKSQESLDQHLRSKKHLKAAAGKTNTDDVVGTRVVRKEESEDTSADPVDKRIEKGRRLGPLECLFSGHLSATPEENAEYMYMNYGFFIPDVEYLVDLPGLLSYLGDKVGVGFCCVYCHRVFESVQAARQHMLAAGHCKIVYGDDDDEEAGEFDEFYDFSAT